MGPRVYSGIAGPGKAFLDPQNPRTMTQNLERAEAEGRLDKEVCIIRRCSLDAQEEEGVHSSV